MIFLITDMSEFASSRLICLLTSHTLSFWFMFKPELLSLKPNPHFIFLDYYFLKNIISTWNHLFSFSLHIFKFVKILGHVENSSGFSLWNSAHCIAWLLPFEKLCHKFSAFWHIGSDSNYINNWVKSLFSFFFICITKQLIFWHFLYLTSS